MLRVGLTGGIGSGKSTVAATFRDLGAVVVDADRVAREVVEPGMPALAAIRERFGRDVIGPDGALDRMSLGRVVFADEEALRDLEEITHPAIWARTADLIARAVADDPTAVVVHDMPLIVEKQMSAEYHLVAVVDTDEETRVRRLVSQRRLPEDDARARIRAQATDAERRAAADVVVDNNGTTAQTRSDVAELWHQRVVPFEENLRMRRRSSLEHPVLSDWDPGWPAAAERLLGRLRRAGGPVVRTADHVGSTSVPGLVARDVIDVQVGVGSLADADAPELVAALAEAGFPRVEGITSDEAPDGTCWPKRFHGSCDPGRVAHIHVREVGSPGWAWALAFRDWLRADAAAREEYAAVKRDLARRYETSEAYAAAREPWFAAVRERVEVWTGRAT